MTETLTKTVGMVILVAAPLTFTMPMTRAVADVPVVQHLTEGTRSGGVPTSWWGTMVSTTAGYVPAPSFLIKGEASNEREAAMTRRIGDLARLQDGWLGDGSFAPSPAVTTWLASHAAQICQANEDVVLVPTGDGTVVLEWNIAAVEYTAELGPSDMLLVIDDTATDALTEASTSLDEEALLRFLATGLIE